MRVDKYALRRFIAFTPLAIVLAWLGWWGVNEAVEPPAYSCAVRIVEVVSGDTSGSFGEITQNHLNP